MLVVMVQGLVVLILISLFWNVGELDGSSISISIYWTEYETKIV